VLLAGATAQAEDPRVAFLTKQLASVKDPRLRAQNILLLGQTGSPEAVPPLCSALRDPESVVRSAAASSLGELRIQAALDCIKSAMGETDESVRNALARALAAGVITPGGLYVAVEPIQDKVGGLPDSLLKLADTLLRDKLSGMGAAFAPPNEEKKSAASLIKSHNLRGYQLRVQLLPGDKEKSLKVEMLIMTYPDQSLQGSFNVKAAGAKPETLLKAMMPKVVDDAAGDLQWMK